MKLDAFVTAYLECALWSSTDDDDGPFDSTYDITDIADESVAAAIAECTDFRDANRDALNAADADDAQHGHDFWLTRNGHGAGFWDRGYGEVGDRLSKAAKVYGSCDVYVGDDGKLYLS